MSSRNNLPNYHGTNGDYVDGSSDGECYKLRSDEKSVLNMSFIKIIFDIYLFLYIYRSRAKSDNNRLNIYC
jgi:hypothetical protein